MTRYEGRDGTGVVVAEYDPLRERQYDMWWRTVIAGPAPNTAGVLGNDFPGAYLHDPTTGREHLLFLDADVDWTVTSAGLAVRDGKFVLGFWAPGPLTGELRIAAREVPTLPTRAEALTHLIQWCTTWLPEPPAADDVPHYDELAAAAFAESLRDDSGLMTVAGRRGHRMYVAGTSEAWDDATVDHLELLCQSDVAFGIATLPQPTAAQTAWLDRLTGLIGDFYSPRLDAFSNVFPLSASDLHGGNVIVGRDGDRESTNVWYHLYNHARLAEIALHADVSWAAQLRNAADHTLRLALANRWVFPLFWWLDAGQALTAADEPAAGGAFAWFMVRAFDLWGDECYLDAAGEALETLSRLPVDRIYGAGVLLPRAAWAANALADRTGACRWRELRDYFTAAALRTLYWRGDLAGMFQACAGMCYPAMFENVANLLAFDDFLDESPFPLRQVLGLQLRGNLRFFDGDCAIPLENLATAEYPYAGRVGREIYAVGEVLHLPYLRERYRGGAARGDQRAARNPDRAERTSRSSSSRK